MSKIKMPKTPHQRAQQRAYGTLIRSTEALPPGQTLPVDELPDVKRSQRAEYRKRTPVLGRLGESAVKLDSLWREAGDIAVAQFRDRQPNVALREGELHAKWEKEEAERQRRDALSRVTFQADFATEYFQKGSVYSFSKAIPRRPGQGQEGFDGSYLELARTTLGDALTYKREDGTIPLLGAAIARERFAAKEAAGTPVDEFRKSEESYVGGAATALWKLGFVEFEAERQLRYGNGRFSPDVVHGRTPDNQAATVSIGFNPENELHRMLVPEGSALSNPRIEAEMPLYIDPRAESYINLRVVEAPVPAAA